MVKTFSIILTIDIKIYLNKQSSVIFESINLLKNF